MKDIPSKIIEIIKSNKGKIRKIVLTTVAIAIIGSGIAVGALYSYARSNINYSEKQLEEIAIKKIPGEVVNIKKEFEDATIEYTFQIKDKDNILQEVTVSSKTGAITDIERHDLDGNDCYGD